MSNTRTNAPVLDDEYMIASQAQTEALQKALETRLANPPKGFGFSAKEMDEITEGKDLSLYLFRIVNDGSYLDHFLGSIGWWAAVARDLINPDIVPSSDIDVVKTIAAHTGRILSLYGECFTGYWTYAATGGEYPDPTGLEMIKRYREFTRFVCSMAAKFNLPQSLLAELERQD